MLHENVFGFWMISSSICDGLTFHPGHIPTARHQIQREPHEDKAIYWTNEHVDLERNHATNSLFSH